MLDFSLSDEQKALTEAARRFARERIAPVAAVSDHQVEDDISFRRRFTWGAVITAVAVLVLGLTAGVSTCMALVGGLVLATGHGSLGVTQSLGSGEAIADGIADGNWDPALAPARLARSPSNKASPFCARSSATSRTSAWTSPEAKAAGTLRTSMAAGPKRSSASRKPLQPCRPSVRPPFWKPNHEYRDSQGQQGLWQLQGLA